MRDHDRGGTAMTRLGRAVRAAGGPPTTPSRNTAKRTGRPAGCAM
jgi:hypothetical protein